MATLSSSATIPRPSAAISGSGNITISAGSLFINGGLSGSKISITGGALGGNSTISSDVAIGPGTTLQAGGSTADASGVLGLGNLTVSGGTLAFNLGHRALAPSPRRRPISPPPQPLHSIS